MTSVDWLREFKRRIIIKFNVKTTWGKNELEKLIDQVYQEILEEMINPND